MYAMKDDNLHSTFQCNAFFLKAILLLIYYEWLVFSNFNYRSPLVSFLYERGWRQNFNRSGFPGPEEEVSLSYVYSIINLYIIM